jgi:hypothetical protein
VTGESRGPVTEDDFATIKYNASGVEQCVVRYNGPGNTFDLATALAVDAAGNIYVTGRSNQVGNSTITTIKYTQIPLLVNNNNEGVPNEFSLEQNYPNPFNPVTKIRFDIPGEAHQLKINIYNMLGRKVETLVNQQLKPGTYEVEWNAGNYPSGVYFYKLSAGDFTETKRMVLVK